MGGALFRGLVLFITDLLAELPGAAVEAEVADVLTMPVVPESQAAISLGWLEDLAVQHGLVTLLSHCAVHVHVVAWRETNCQLKHSQSLSTYCL